jgi:branched-chain amino acid transport system substrate-binding protein
MATSDAPPAPGRTAAAQDDPPYRKSSPEPLDFRGAGREKPEPEVDEVLLGWFGPGDPGHPEFGDYWRGAVVALEQENSAGGYRGRHFRLEPAWSESPWKAGVVDVARLVNGRGAWAVVGGIDGTTTHLAVQLALKSRFLLLSPGSTDVTSDDANVPWLFSLPPADDAVAGVLAQALSGGSSAGGGVSEGTAGAIAIAAGTDHDSHESLVALRRVLAERRMSPAALVEVPTEAPDVSGVAAQLLRARPRTLVVLARPRLAAGVVSAARQAGFGGTAVGGPGCSVAAFARAAGASAEGVLAPALVEDGSDAAGFAGEFEARWHEPPDAAARLGYDAVRVVAEAVRRAGLNRARIRDAVRALAPWTGASGAVAWNARGRNQRPPVLGRWQSGRLVQLAP